MKRYKPHVIATLLLTASVSAHGAGSNPFDCGMQDSNAAAGILETLTTQSINGIRIQSIPENDPVTEPVTSIDGATALGMTLPPEEAFNLMCNRILKPHNTNVDGLINLFCGQISSAHINQTAEQLFRTLQEATSLRINTMQISRSVQLIRTLHTLLSYYRPECADELFKSCVIDVLPDRAREIYLWVPPEVADLLLQLQANGMYMGRNVLFVSDIENGKNLLKESFDAISKGILPGNVPKSPLVIEYPLKTPRSNNITTDSNAAAGILETLTTQNINGIHIQNIPADDPVTEPVTSIDGSKTLGMTLPPEEAFNLMCNGILKPHNTNVDGLINLFCGQISSAHINQTAEQLFKTLQEATSLRINTMQISRSVQLIRTLHTLLTYYRPECADELFGACVINAVPARSREIYLWVPQDLADLLLQLHANGMYTGRNVLFVSDSENGRDLLKERFNAISKGILPGNVPKSPLVIELANPHNPSRSKKIAIDSNALPFAPTS